MGFLSFMRVKGLKLTESFNGKINICLSLTLNYLLQSIMVYCRINSFKDNLLCIDLISEDTVCILIFAVQLLPPLLHQWKDWSLISLKEVMDQSHVQLLVILYQKLYGRTVMGVV